MVRTEAHPSGLVPQRRVLPARESWIFLGCLLVVRRLKDVRMCLFRKFGSESSLPLKPLLSLSTGRVTSIILSVRR